MNKIGLGVTVGLYVLCQSIAPAAERFELNDGDRVVFLGNTMIERAQRYGHIETMLTTCFPNRQVTFRNLGWSGDTVWAESRGIFDPPAAGYRRMLEHVNRLKPTVIVLGYGGNEAYAGPSGLDRFARQAAKLLTDLERTGARIVVLSPLPRFPARSDTHAAVRRNEQLADANRILGQYAQALQTLADDRGHRYVDLTTWPAQPTDELVEPNGIHLTDAGYRRLAVRLAEQLELNPAEWDPARREQLRKTVVEKNRFYFHRWRPQNVTYLFGFRKHEQGQNAKEVPQFDKLVAQKEAEIARLRQPTSGR